ncbi:MAG TPA: hypothetical protein VF895_09175 [Gaiellaceae bacterium]
MRLTRRELLAGAAVSAVAGTGIYELVDRLGRPPSRAASAGFPREQHVLDGVRVVRDDGIEVVVPPLHHRIVTAKLRVGHDRASLVAARDELEHALAGIERGYEPTPAGLGVSVGWGLPYFDRYVPGPAEEHIPTDLRASRDEGRTVKALTHSIRFPSDPGFLVLEDNDVAFLVRSDDLGAVQSGAKRLLGLDLLEPTSVRVGFAGGGFEGGMSLPKRMALAAKIPGADLVPATAELFLGFTSTQKAGLGPTRIANLETLRYTNALGGYFDGGTHMALSHIFEDLEGWYLTFDFRDRVDTTFKPGMQAKDGAQTIPQGPKEVSTVSQVARDFHKSGTIGHSASIQTSSRLTEDVRGTDGVLYRKGTAIPHRADFNTLDNPFAWSSRPKLDAMADGPAAGVHFVVFNPSSDDFRRNRLAMDGLLPDGTKLPFQRGARGQGLNSILTTTHRQNFLVPPRRHRSFPLVDLLA